MCGIYATNFPFTENEIRTKLKAIEFRGPDYTGVLKKDKLSFGHLRLSILDLDVRSNQPMQIEDFTIVFNGEIFNYLELSLEYNLGTEASKKYFPLRKEIYEKIR